MTEYILHQKKETWGDSILIMESKGKGFARVYQYDDDKSACYCDMLSVSESFRNKGLGTELINYQMRIVKEHFKVNRAALTVLKGSWMQEWYKRLGFVDFPLIPEFNGYVWMYKELDNEKI